MGIFGSGKASYGDRYKRKNPRNAIAKPPNLITLECYIQGAAECGF